VRTAGSLDLSSNRGINSPVLNTGYLDLSLNNTTGSPITTSNPMTSSSIMTNTGYLDLGINNNSSPMTNTGYLDLGLNRNTSTPVINTGNLDLGLDRNISNPATKTGNVDFGVNRNTGNPASNAGFLDLSFNSNNGNVAGNGRPDIILAADNGGNKPQINNLMFLGDRNINDATRLTINTKNGPVELQLDPLRTTNGEIVRAQNGQPLMQSISTINKVGVRESLDLKDITLAAQSGVPQQGLILDIEATRANPGSVVMLRQDGARLTYSVPENSTQPRITDVSSQDGQRHYFYDNPARPDLATRIVDSYHDQYGTQLLQLRERLGTSDVFTLKEMDRQTGQIRKEVALSVQLRHDGQLVYQRYIDPQEIQRRTAAGEFDNRVDANGKPVTRKEILDAIENDRSWLIANDLPAAKRQLLNATKGRLFGGDDAKTENYIDMYITRIRDWRKKGYMTATDDQLAFSLRRMTEVFTSQRTGTAAKMSDSILNKHAEGMLTGMGSPKKFNNQAQIGSCYVNSYRVGAEYIYPHLVVDKWASIMTKGELKRAKFSVSELTRNGVAGQTRWNAIMNGLCYKYRKGPNYVLNGGSPGTAEFQAQREYKLLTDGGNLPLTRAARKKTGIQMAYTYGGAHAQTWIENWLNNTWNGYAEKGKGPADRVEHLDC
jgi:hypothetical protein